MQAKKEEIKRTFTEVFNKVSPIFDESGPRYFAYFGERLVEMAGVHAGSKVLDVATGRGASLFPSAAKAGNEGSVVGIDISEGMVKETTLQIEQRNIKNAQARVMDAESLMFPDETFDYILCGFGIFFFPAYDAALKEFKRVLKKGGKLGFTTFLRNENNKFKPLYELGAKFSPPQDSNEPKEKEANSPEFDTREGLHKILFESGYTDIRIETEEMEFWFKTEQEWWDKRWSTAERLFMDSLPPKSLEQLKAETLQKLGEMMEPEGISCTISVLFAFGTK